MAITDEQIAPLRAQLSRQPEEFLRLFDLLEPSAKNPGYRVLVSAAFVVAVQRRFTRSTSAAEVIEFVGNVRSRSPEIADQVDPVTAERIISAIFSGQSLDDIDPRVSWETQNILMAAIIGDEQLDASGLEAFLGEARKLADQWLA